MIGKVSKLNIASVAPNLRSYLVLFFFHERTVIVVLNYVDRLILLVDLHRA